MNMENRLKDILNSIGIDKPTIAKQCDISLAQLYNYLSGKQPPNSSFLKLLKDHYPWINLDWLISGEGNPRLDEPDHSNVVFIDIVAQIIKEAEEETGVTLNTRQREAVAKILRKEIEHRNKEAQEQSKSEILELVASFGSEANEG